MSGKIILTGGVVFTLMAIIVGVSIYGLNQEETKYVKRDESVKAGSNVVKPKTESISAATENYTNREVKTTKVNTAARKVFSGESKSESLVDTKDDIKLEPHHLYVKSDEQIQKEFQRRRTTERRIYKMREMRERRLKERKFQEMKNKRKEENA